MSEQLSFNLPIRVARGRASFYVSEANANAVANLDAPETWPLGKMILQGPAASGKSHLLDIWREDNGGVICQLGQDFDLPNDGAAVVVDDIDSIAGDKTCETRLFHLHNHLGATQGKFLMATSQPVGHCGFVLPDLLSRLQGTQVAKIAPPDDDLLGAVLLKNFSDRQLSPPPQVQSYILKHMNRSFADAADIVAALDDISMREKRSITRAMAGEVIDRLADD